MQHLKLMKQFFFLNVSEIDTMTFTRLWARTVQGWPGAEWEHCRGIQRSLWFQGTSWNPLCYPQCITKGTATMSRERGLGGPEQSAEMKSHSYGWHSSESRVLDLALCMAAGTKQDTWHGLDSRALGMQDFRAHCPEHKDFRTSPGNSLACWLLSLCGPRRK